MHLSDFPILPEEELFRGYLTDAFRLDMNLSESYRKFGKVFGVFAVVIVVIAAVLHHLESSETTVYSR